MRYEECVVKSVVESVLSGRSSRRGIARALGIGRTTVKRWVDHALAGLPSRLSRAAKNVWNRTKEPVLAELRSALAEGKSAVVAWIGAERRVCLRTAQRWKAAWFPKPRAERKKWRRYVRRKALSLAHTDWATKWIGDGSRACLTFYVDDATRMVSACGAYAHADEANTANALRRAVVETGGSRQVLTDCGAVFSKAFRALCADVGAQSIHTRPYHPQCNGKAEAVVKKLKAFLDQHMVRDLAHANALCKEFQRAHNRAPHSGLNYATPLQAYAAKQGAGLIWGVT